jgi:hypothetical protein
MHGGIVAGDVIVSVPETNPLTKFLPLASEDAAGIDSVSTLPVPRCRTKRNGRRKGKALWNLQEVSEFRNSRKPYGRRRQLVGPRAI